MSCKKTSSTNSCAITEANLEGNYKITDATYQDPADGIPETDVFSNPLFASEFPACQKDDIISLNANNVYVYTDAGVVCSPNGSSTGSWELKSDTLIRVTPSKNDSVVISSFNCSAAILVKNNVSAQGDQLKITFTRQ